MMENCKVAALSVRWGYIKARTNESCIRDETLGYKALLEEIPHTPTRSPGGSAFDLNIKPIDKKRSVPWTIRLVYNLNYFSAIVFNHTVQFYNLAGFEAWANKKNSASFQSAQSSKPCFVICMISFLINI